MTVRAPQYICSNQSRRSLFPPPMPKAALPPRCDCLTPKATPHNSKCRYGERGAVAARPKAQIILDAAKVSAASGGNSEQKQGQRSQSARDFCPRSTMRVPQPDIIEHFGNAYTVPQPPERCLSRKAGIVRYCPNSFTASALLLPSFCGCPGGPGATCPPCRWGILREHSWADPASGHWPGWGSGTELRGGYGPPRR